MNTFLLTISTPDGDVFSGKVVMISLRGIEGELAVMAGHIPFVTSIKACDVKIELADENESLRVGHTDGGLLTVTAQRTTLLTGHFEWVE